MKRKHIILITSLLIAITVSLLGSRDVVHSEEMLIKDSIISTRNITIGNLEEEITGIEEEYNLMKEDYEQLGVTNYDLSAQLVLIEKSLEDAKTEIAKEKVDKEAAIAKVKALQTQVLEYTGSDDFHQNMIAEKEALINKLMAENKELEFKIEQEKQKNTKLLAYIQELEQQLIANGDSVILISAQIKKIQDDKNEDKLEKLEKEKQNLLNDRDSLNNKIEDIKNEIPPVYAPVAYYYAVIKKHIPGKIFTKKDNTKFYLDDKDDYSNDVESIYFSFQINQILFENNETAELEFKLKGDFDEPLTTTCTLTKGDQNINAKLFSDLKLKEGVYSISVKIKGSNEKLIEDYTFKLL